MNPADRVDHRPWPLPRSPWVMTQTWHDLLFAHWPISREALRPSIPPALEIDTFEGRAWLGVVPFRMSGVRLRGTPSLPWLSAFPELNLRTYVTRGGKPGVWFFALDAGNPIAVEIARRWFHLPYFRAEMSAAPIDAVDASERRDADETRAGLVAESGIAYSSRRCDPRGRDAELLARFGPSGRVYHSVRGTLEHWLTERYCLYALDAHESVVRAEIHHHPWPLQAAQAEIERCTLPAAHDLELPATPPLLHFARRLDVIVWRPRRVE